MKILSLVQVVSTEYIATTDHPDWTEFVRKSEDNWWVRIGQSDEPAPWALEDELEQQFKQLYPSIPKNECRWEEFHTQALVQTMKGGCGHVAVYSLQYPWNRAEARYCPHCGRIISIEKEQPN